MWKTKDWREPPGQRGGVDDQAIDHDHAADGDDNDDDDDDLEVEAEDGEGGIVGEGGSGSKKKPICQVQPFNPLIMMAMMMLILLEIMMALNNDDLKNKRGESKANGGNESAKN